jgi:Arc/MetJ family transcription regulator
MASALTYDWDMRTTITLDDDVAAEVDRLRRESGVGVSEAVNRLVRSGMARPRNRAVFEQRAIDMGQRIDVADIGGVLELLNSD